VIPVVTPEEMAAIDAAAPDPVEVLIERAGAAVARRARAMLGGTYGRRVVVVAGGGNNGNDGRVAGARLAAEGAKVTVVPPDHPGPLPEAHLVIDAAFGTGLTRPYDPPPLPGSALVLAVDIPSGVHGLTGVLHGSPWTADETVTFAALKPGLVLSPGRWRTGRITVADIGLDVSRARAAALVPADLRELLPRRALDAHKWRAACWMIGGSPGMGGAAALAARGAQRAGAGYVRLSVPGGGADGGPPEAVGHPLAEDLWTGEAPPDDLARFRALVLGPGIGRTPSTQEGVRRLLATAPVPVVVDGDALHAVGPELLAARPGPTVLTPHDGEFAVITGSPPGEDRMAAARSLAARTGCVVLLKGPTTVIAAPDGLVRLVVDGHPALATAGTGDVLAGMVGALLARGCAPLDAAAAGAEWHALAATEGLSDGLVAGDLPDRLPRVLERLDVGS
jgi:ADP-dependent NAD(P)H-hydrate dehydratase / NAD(P)H-hydrate epimerase